MRWNEPKNGKIKTKKCKICKHYKECSKNIYLANIARRYFIEYLHKDCFEEK